MKIRWMTWAAADLNRLEEFLRPASPFAAARTVQRLIAAPKLLLQQPRRGERLEAHSPREVRRLLVGAYEIQYEIVGDDIVILRVFHTREDR